MSNEEIAENLQARDVTLKRGALGKTCSKMGVPPNSRGNEKYSRNHYYKLAQKRQTEQFENMVFELGIEGLEAWTKSKMDEEFLYNHPA